MTLSKLISIQFFSLGALGILLASSTLIAGGLGTPEPGTEETHLEELYEASSNDISEDQLAQLVPHVAEYQATIKKGLSINGKALRKLEFRASSDQWQYSFDVDSSVADIKEKSKLSWFDGTLQPREYSYKLSGFFIKDKEQNISFLQNKKQAKGNYNKGSWKVNYEGTALDRLSYQLQLAYDVALGKTEMSYRVVHKGRIEEYPFKVIRKEQIDTVLGPQKAIVVTKVRSAKKKRETFIWFSEEHPLLLLKMTQKEKDGEFYEIKLTRLIQYG